MQGVLSTTKVYGSSATQHAVGARTEITEAPSYSEKTFRFMVLYRWAALATAILLTFFSPTTRSLASPFVIAGFTLAYTLTITLTSRPVNRLLRRYPPLLGLDLVFVGLLLAATGGWNSPYYLYALSPILAAAFFFLWPGAIMAATGLAVLFGVGLWWQWLSFDTLPAWEIALTYLIGFYLIGGLFSYPATLLRRLRQAHHDLRTHNSALSLAHQELQIIHDLTRAMQSASDPSDVQEQLLGALVGLLDFPRAVIALANPTSHNLSSWLSQNKVGGSSTPLSHIAGIPFETDPGSLAETLRQGRPQTIVDGRVPSGDPVLNKQLALGPTYTIFPLIFRGHPVGVVAVSLPDSGLSPGDEDTLVSVISQAAVALSNVQLCIDRTRRLTMEEERNRIAREIHDTVSQSLFGMVYTLDSCIKLLPQQSETVKTRLVKLYPQAIEVMDKVRRSIYELWESEVTAEHFQERLQHYTRQVCQGNGLALLVSVDEDFETLDPELRRTFLRVAQESIANVVKHAEADQATIGVVLLENEVVLLVVDNGVGIESRAIGSESEEDYQHLGLLSMQDRVALLGGMLTINHRCDRGTTVKVTVPLPQNGNK